MNYIRNTLVPENKESGYDEIIKDINDPDTDMPTIMLDIREELKFCCNAFLKDGLETDALNYVRILNWINKMIRDLGWSNAVTVDIIVNSDEICLRISICGDNYSIAAIRINNGKIIFKDILDDEFDMAVNFLIRNHHLIECYK